MNITYDKDSPNRINIVAETELEQMFLDNPGGVDFANFLFYNQPITDNLIATNLDRLRKAFIEYENTTQLPNFDPSARFNPTVIPRKLRSSWDISAEDALRKLKECIAKITHKGVIFNNTDFEDNAYYDGCTFYFAANFEATAIGCTFNNCSFRSDVFFTNLGESTFTNCGFSGNVFLSTHCPKVDLPYLKNILSLPFITHLALGHMDINDAYWQEDNREEIFYNLDWSVMVNLTRLELNGCGLKEVPKLICSLPKLEVLDLYDNNIKVLPEEFMFLKTLKILDLSRNLFTWFPPELGYVNNLEILHFYNVSCHVINYEFLELKHLRKMIVSQDIIEGKTSDTSLQVLTNSKEEIKTHIDYMNDTNMYYPSLAVNFLLMCSTYLPNCEIVNASQETSESVDIHRFKNIGHIDYLDSIKELFISFLGKAR